MPLPFPTTGILDDFLRADVGPPPSASWTTYTDGGITGDGLKVVSNAIKGDSASVPNAAYFSDTTFGPNCENFITVTSRPTPGDDVNLYVKFDPGAGNGYGLELDGSSFRLNIIESEAASTLASTTISFSNGDKIGLRYIGDTLEGWYKAGAGSWTRVLSVVDTTFQADTGYLMVMLLNDDTVVDDFGGGDFVPVASFFVIDDTFALTESELWPLLISDDDFPLDDDLVIVRAINDDFPLDDEFSLAALFTVDDDFPLPEFQAVSGTGIVIPTPVPPGTGGVSTENNTVLRLLYGNDKRNPIRTLDLAEVSSGSIQLKDSGFAPGSGELIELWSGQSLHMEGQKKIAESRDNTKLSLTCVLDATNPATARGSSAALSYFQSKINLFFTEAKVHQVQFQQGHKVWLEYRWADGLNTLPTPTFGGLSRYYEILSAKAPKWPASLHSHVYLERGLIEEVQMEFTASPASEGLKLRAALGIGDLADVARGVRVGTATGSCLFWGAYGSSGMTGQFTVSVWVTAYENWSGARGVFNYQVDGSNKLTFNYASTLWNITKIVGGTTFSVNSAAFPVVSGQSVHLVAVQDSTTLHLYANGVQVASVAATATLPDDGDIYVGFQTGGDFDGCRILPAALTSTQAAALYAAELPIKQDGGKIGPPPYWWTKDNDGQVGNVNDATRDNYGILAGVGGDLEAKLEIRTNNSVTGDFVTWVGLRATDEKVDAADYYYFESTASVGGTSAHSGSAYIQGSGSLTDTSAEKTIKLNELLGKYQVLARLSITMANVASIVLCYRYGDVGYFFNSKAVTYTGTGTMDLVDLGQLILAHPNDNLAEVDTSIYYRIIVVGAPSFTTAQFDFAQLLPYPFARVECFTDSSPVVIEDGVAYPFQTTPIEPTGYAEYRGVPIRAMPNKYNYIFFALATAAGVFNATHTADVSIWVTPRYQLPGGMVA